MPFYPNKGQKGPKVGGAVGKNQLFCILPKIVSLDYFHILHKLEGIKAPDTIFQKNSHFPKKWKKGSENRQIGLTVTFFKCQYPTQLLKILKIWFHIWISLEMYFRNGMDNFFSITTPSPLKMGAKLGNVSGVAWFPN